jgi:hypothetical protein
MHRLRNAKHFVLLTVSIAMLVLEPFAHGIVGGLILFDGVFTVVMLGMFLVVFRSGGQRIGALVIGVPTIVTRWAAYATTGDWRFDLLVAHHLLVGLFFAYAVVMILRGIFAQAAINADHLFGSACGFLFMGIVWANGYLLTELLLPRSFEIAPRIAWQLQDEHTRSYLFNYFSFCTLTSVAYGDVTPVRPGVATFTWLEAMFGQFYLAIVVAQMVGLKLTQALERSKPA